MKPCNLGETKNLFNLNLMLSLPHYTSKDYQVLAITLGPITLAVNGVIFGSSYFADWKILLLATPVTALVFALDFIACGQVAVIMKNRFPGEQQVGRRIALMISSFFALTGLTLLILFRGYESIPLLDYTFSPTRFTWAYIGMCIINVFFTFVHEGIARYENWRVNIEETEAVKKLYRQSRLMGLKSQVNPHFLFNSLNSLSCLIQESPEKSERFLNEMTRVYRYMLQNDEEQFVTLDTELNFIESYLYLLCERHCECLRVVMNIEEKDRHKLIPPLALQAIVENIVSQNAFTREQPLEILVYSEEKGQLVISNNLLPRNLMSADSEPAASLDNLARKYELLGLPPMQVHATATERIIRLPLVQKEEVLA